MDEEKQREEEQEEQKQSIPGQIARQGMDYAKQQAKNAIKEKAKKTAIKVGAKIAAFVAAHIIPILIIITVLVILFGFLFPAFDNYLDELMAEDVDEITYQTLEEYCTIDDTGVHMDKEGFLKNIIANLSEAGIDLNSLGFGDDGNYKVIRRQ